MAEFLDILAIAQVVFGLCGLSLVAFFGMAPEWGALYGFLLGAGGERLWGS